MRVAFFVSEFPKLSETFILNQVIGLLDAGVDVDVYAWHGDSNETLSPHLAPYRLHERARYLGLPARRLPRVLRVAGSTVRTRGWRRPGRLCRMIASGRRGSSLSTSSLLHAGGVLGGEAPYDIVHSQFGGLGPKALALKRAGVLSGKLVVSFRGADLTRRGRAQEYVDLFREGDLFLPVCEYFREKLVALGCDAAKTEVHRSGVDPSRFDCKPRRRTAGEPVRLLTVGRLTEKKGIRYAIDAVARLERAGHAVRYTVVGDGELHDDLARRVREAGLGDTVRLEGSRPHHEVVARLEEAHIFLAPSVTASDGDQEGIPNTLKEAMATGLPVASTRHSGIPELVEDGMSGVLVPEADSAALADALGRLIREPERWEAMGRAGRERVECEYDIHCLTETLVRRYHQVVGGSVVRGERTESNPAKC